MLLLSLSEGQQFILIGTEHFTVLDNNKQAIIFRNQLVLVGDSQESRKMLRELNPAETALLEAEDIRLEQDPDAVATVVKNEEAGLRIRYQSSSEALLRIAVPYFPGWRAGVNGSERRVLPVDHAFIGVVVPAGDHELDLRFHSNYFGLGAAITAATLLLVVVVIVVVRVRGERR